MGQRSLNLDPPGQSRAGGGPRGRSSTYIRPGGMVIHKAGRAARGCAMAQPRVASHSGSGSNRAPPPRQVRGEKTPQALAFRNNANVSVVNYDNIV